MVLKKNGTIYRRFLFGPSLIVRLFPRKFFHGPTMVNGMARFDLYGKESKANVYGNDMFIQLFYKLYFIYMEKKVKQMFMEMICLYNYFIRCI